MAELTLVELLEEMDRHDEDCERFGVEPYRLTDEEYEAAGGKSNPMQHRIIDEFFDNGPNACTCGK